MQNPPRVLRQRFERALGTKAPNESLHALAVALRDEGCDQLTVYRLFAHYQQQTDGQSPLYDAIVDNMDLIWGGPWAKGRGIFPTELTEGDLA